MHGARDLTSTFTSENKKLEASPLGQDKMGHFGKETTESTTKKTG